MARAEVDGGTVMADKFTQGPWEVLSVAGWPSVFRGEMRVASVGGYSIRDMRDDPAKAAEVVANAWLIAAAPEMLAALRLVYQVMPEQCTNEIALIAEAISHATGSTASEEASHAS